MHAEATHAPPLSSARALRRPDESRPVRLDDRVVARLSRAVDCVRCAVVRACVVVVVARADARPARASARHRVRMRPFAPRPFAPYALPAHGAPMHAFGARRSQTPCICSAGADEAAARKRARPESHARAFASIRFITPANPWTIPFFHVLPTPPPAHRRPSRSFACIGRRALAAFVDCFVGCFADNSWLRSTAAHEAWRASRRLAAPLPAAPIARLRARVRRRRFGSRPNIGVLYTARAVSNVVLIELIFNKER